MKIVAPLIVLTAMLLGLPLLGAVLAAIVVPCHFGKGHAFTLDVLGLSSNPSASVAGLVVVPIETERHREIPAKPHTAQYRAQRECVEEAAAVHHHRLAPYQDGDERQRYLAPSPDPEIQQLVCPSSLIRPTPCRTRTFP